MYVNPDSMSKNRNEVLYVEKKDEELLRAISAEIVEYEMMVDHFIKLQNKEEIAYWRRALQCAKIHKRSILTR